MRQLFFILIVCCGLVSCDKKNIIVDKTGKCFDKPDTGTTCMAYWESWFYDEATGKCTKIGYSGCHRIGCDTEKECQECAITSGANLKE